MYNYTTNYGFCKDVKSEKLTDLGRILIGLGAIWGPVAKIANKFNITPRYVYKLRQICNDLFSSIAADSVGAVQSFCNKLLPDANMIVVNEKFIKKTIIAASLDGGASAEGIQRMIENIFKTHVSIGFISNTLAEAVEKAALFDAKIDLSNISQGANDEIFQCGMPIFTGVDTETTYTYLLKQESDRSADTWQSVMEECKLNGLNLQVSISDCGTGLLSGIPKAFPSALVQPDLFHWLMELGELISSLERTTYSRLDEVYRYEKAVNGPRPRMKTIEKMDKLKPEMEAEISKYDKLSTLYNWLKELTSYQGIGYAETTATCKWILDEMEATEGISYRMRKVLIKTRKHMPKVLTYLQRAEKTLKENARKDGYTDDTYILMYRLSRYDSNSVEFKAIVKRLLHTLKGNFDNVYFKVLKILDGVKRASSLVENLNGRLRKYINLKRIVPEKYLTLLKVYFNTRKYKRSRRPERIGKSPLELLTGKPHPDFYDIVC